MADARCILAHRSGLTIGCSSAMTSSALTFPLPSPRLKFGPMVKRRRSVPKPDAAAAGAGPAAAAAADDVDAATAAPRRSAAARPAAGRWSRRSAAGTMRGACMGGRAVRPAPRTRAAGR